jgi:rsbT antagonist protein RsbS
MSTQQRAHSPVGLVFVGDTLLCSLPGELTDAAVRQLRRNVGEALRVRDVRGVVLDLTAVDTLDSYITRCVRDIAVAARLMGSETVVCGLRPSVATTVVDMGLDLERVPTALNLDHALALLDGAGVGLRGRRRR